MTYTDIFQASFLAMGMSGGPKSRALFLDFSAGKRAHWRRSWSSPETGGNVVSGHRMAAPRYLGKGDK